MNLYEKANCIVLPLFIILFFLQNSDLSVYNLSFAFDYKMVAE